MWTHTFFPQIWDHIFKTVFPKQFFCFLFLTLGCIKTCANCVTKCVTDKIYPLKIKFYKLYVSKAFYRQFFAISHKIETILSNKFFLNVFFLFSFEAPKFVNCVKKYTMPKISWQSDLHGKMNPNMEKYYLIWYNMVQILSLRSSKWVRHNQVSWSSS